MGLKVSFKDRIKALQSGTPAVATAAEPRKSEPSICKPNSLLVEVAANPSENIREQLIPASSTPAPIITPMSGKCTKPCSGISLKEKIKSLSAQTTNAAKEEPLKPWSKLKLATVVSGGGSYSSLNNSPNEESPTGAGPSSNSTGSKSSFSEHTTSSKLNPGERILKGIMKHSSTGHRKIQSTTELERIKHRRPVRPVELTSVSDSEQSLFSSKLFLKRSQKQEQHSRSKLGSASHKHRPKNYRSVDDLSPEYSGLPFVKKLKILNERQKLAELEHVIQTRSFSLDCPESIVHQTIYSGGAAVVSGLSGQQTSYPASLEPAEPLTRSQSDASGMAIGPFKYNIKSHKLSQKPQPLDTLSSVHPHRHHQQHVQSHSPLSPESNETMERKQLKSILKRLSEDQGVRNQKSHPRPTSINAQDLMRAPTVEGYVARHSKLLKSVTFNNTLSSPPPINSTTGQISASTMAAAVKVAGSGAMSVPGPETVLPTRSPNNSPSSFFADLYDPIGVVIEEVPGQPALHTSATTMTTRETTVITSTTVINNANSLNGPKMPNAHPEGMNYGPPIPYDKLQLSEKFREAQLIQNSEHDPIISEFPLKANLAHQKKLKKGKLCLLSKNNESRFVPITLIILITAPLLPFCSCLTHL